MKTSTVVVIAVVIMSMLMISEADKTCNRRFKRLQKRITALELKVKKLENKAKDIDKCSTNSHSCDVNAVCTNTAGSYTCGCKAGYSGDGRTCTDINECVSGVHDCNSFASCTNTPGSFNCSCDHPFVGNGKSCRHSAPECQNYQSLNSADRRITWGYGSRNDRGIGPGWFRFEGSAGSRMPTSCPPIRRCNTYTTGWMNGRHPTVVDGQVSRQVCFHWTLGCCYHSTNVKVRNCGSYYVYYLHGTPSGGYIRYCGSD